MALIVDIVTEIIKPTGDIYYPKTSEVVIDSQIPYEIDTASISLVEQFSSTSILEGYDEINVFVDNRQLFSGRLDKRAIRFSTSEDSVEWEASDHGAVLEQINVSTDKSYSSTNIGTILENLRSSFVNTDLTGTNINTGPSITNYNVPAWSKKLLPCFKELSKIADYNLYIDFNKDIHFEEKPAIPRDGIKVVEGKNLLKINNFERDVVPIKNYIKVIGDIGFSAFSEDTDSQDSYHKRELVYHDPSLGSNNACQEIADAMLIVNPTESISVSVVGDVNIDAGDLLSVDIPRFNILGDYEVSNITHLISSDDVVTDLELGTKKANLSRLLLALGIDIDRITSGLL